MTGPIRDKAGAPGHRHMRIRRRGHTGRIALGGALAWALVLAGTVPAGAQEAVGPNVVARPHRPAGRVNKITTLLNAISSLPGKDASREKFINELVATTARVATEGHTPANADQWKALGARRKGFLSRRQ